MSQVRGLINEYRNQVLAALQEVEEESLTQALSALAEAQQRGSRVLVLCPPEDSDDGDRPARELLQSAATAPGLRLVPLMGEPRQVASWQNRWALESIYAEQIRLHAQRGDAVIAISCRGQAPSMVRALQAAKRVGATSIALVGFDGGSVKGLADVCLHLRSSVPEVIVDAQMMLVHVLCAALRQPVSALPAEPV